MRLDHDTPTTTFRAPKTAGIARSSGGRGGAVTAAARGDRGRTTAAGSGLLPIERPALLVLRFVVVLSVAFALAAGVVLATVHRFATAEAEESATRQASVIAASLLERGVGTRDLARPVPADRRRELDAVLRPLLASNDVLGVALVRRNGSITYSTDRRTFGASASREHAAEAASGTVVSATGTELDRTGRSAKTLETYAPLRPRSTHGAALIVQPYSPIRHAARSAQARVGGVLEALVLVLYFVFIPLLARMTRRSGPVPQHASTVGRTTT